jgi:hypothetical protein
MSGVLMRESYLNQRLAISLIISFLITSFLIPIQGFYNVPITRALTTANQLIQSHGEILYATSPPSQPQLRVNGLHLEDGLGNQVKLKGIQADWNERIKKYGATWEASYPEESWFTIDDIARMKAAGGNLVEIHINPLADLMPTRNVVNEAYFTTWIDKWVAWATQYQVYCIIDITGIGARWAWEIGLTFPNWLWEGLYPTPTTKAEYDAIMRDFFDLNIAKQDINREAFINLWKFIANRYKDNPYVLFSTMNEPFCGSAPSNNDSNIWLGQSYSTYMERIVDAIRSVGAQQLVFINMPYLWDSGWRMTVKPVNRDNIVWEDHAYVGTSPQWNFNVWKSYIDSYVQKFVNEFKKPLFIGEYGLDPMSLIRTDYPTNWKTILADQVAYLDSLPLAGRQWHQWGYIDGEYYDFAAPAFSGDLTPEESTWIIQTVLG